MRAAIKQQDMKTQRNEFRLIKSFYRGSASYYSLDTPKNQFIFIKTIIKSVYNGSETLLIISNRKSEDQHIEETMHVRFIKSCATTFPHYVKEQLR